MSRVLPYIVICLLSGCSRQPSAELIPQTSSESGVPNHTDLEMLIELREPVTGVAAESRTHPNVAMLAENRTNSVEGGCALANGTSRHAKIRYFQSTREADRYLLTIKLTTHDGSVTTSSTEEKEVVFDGSAHEVWSDEQSRILFCPIAK